MTTPINAASAAYAQPTATTSSGHEMDKDTFLKLLVAQMRYQDPSKPADPTAFISQTAQFTEVEKLGELADLAALQTSLLASQHMLAAANLVGKTVSYTGSDGTEAVGVVRSAAVSGSSPTLRVGDTDVPLSSVKEIRTTDS
ncbi:flagellar hook assembly protein FlgD [Actinomadura hibisca]|uniref:flagellar hook assembly protein FlgD n=1 Tax=Actinomadura hibisca TaxID=68565 RepID=UPI000833B480|nr:flagellar hook capping FlgD N-terminal domain-containing protein [Actinomadura hibisca]